MHKFTMHHYIRRPRPSPRPGRRLGPPQVWTLSSSKPYKPLPLNSFPNRHPRARATAMTFYESQSCRLPARKGSKPFQKFQTPRARATAMSIFIGFQSCRFQPAKALNFPKQNSKHLPQQAPQGQGHFPNRHPRARPQQWLSMGFQSCRLPARKCSKTLQTLQTFPKPAGTPGPGHSNGFLRAFKAAVCQPANAPKLSKRSKPSQNPPNPPNTVRSRPSRSTAMTFLRLSKLPFASLQRLQPHLPQQAPQGQGHFPNRHPRARPQQWLSMGFQSCRLLARKRSETLQTLQMLPKPAKPSKHRPQQALQIHSNDFLEAFKAAVCEPAKAATPPSPTGTPGPSPLPQQAPQGQATAMAFYGLSKLPFASPQTLRNSPNAPNAPKARQTLQTPSPAGPPDPQQWLSWGFQSCRLPACKGCNPTFPNRHPRAKATSRTGTPGPRPLPQQAPQGQATAMAFYGLSKLPFASPQTLQNSPNAPNAPKTRQTLQTPSAAGPPDPQQWLSWGFQSCRLRACKGCNPTFPNRHPRAKATSPTGTPGPGHSNGFLWAFKAAVCQPANAPKLSKRSKCSQNPPNPPNTVRSRPSRSTAMTFLRLSKLPFASLQRLQPHLPQQAPQGQGHFPNRHPRARPQQWLSMGFQSCRLPARKRSETLQTLQMLPKPAKPSKHRPQQALQIHSNDFLEAFKAAVCEPAKAATPPSPTGTPGPRPLPQQAPQGQATAMAFYGLSKLPFASPQTLRNSPNAPNAPKTRQTLQTPSAAGPPDPQQWLSWGFQSCRLRACKGCNPTFPNRHPRAKATSPTGTPGPGHSNGFLWAFKAAVCQPANAPKLSKRSKCSQNPPNPPNTVPSRPPRSTAMTFLRLSKLPFASLQRLQPHLPQQAPQGQGHFPNRHPRAKATSPTGTPRPGHSNGFLWAFKAAVCQPANAPKLSKRSKCSQTRQTLQTPSAAGPPDPQQWLSWGFQSCRLRACKGCNPTFPNRHPRAKATSPTGTPGPGHSNGFLWAFKAAVCQPANAPKLSKRSKCSQNPPNPPNTVRSRPSRSTAMTFLRLSKLPFASLQRLQPHLPQQAPQGQGHFPNRHPRARPQQWLSMGFQSCRLPARKRSETLQTLQMLPKPAKPSKHRPQQAPQIHSNDFLEAFKAAVCQPAKAATPPSPTGTPGPRPLPEQAPQGQGHFPNRHPKARPQQWLSMGFQSCRLPARKRSKTLQTLQTLPKPAGTPGPGHSNGFLWAFKAAVCQPANAAKLSKRSKHRPQQALQIHSNDFLEAFKAAVCEPAKAATPPSPTGTPGPRPLPQQAPQGQATAMAFYGLSKLPFASPQTLRNSPNAPNAPKTRQTLQTPSPAGPPDPQQWLSWGFQSCRLRACKGCNPTFPNRHPRAKATSPTGTPGPGHSNGFLWAFKAAVCRNSPNAPNAPKTRQTLQTPSPAGPPDPQQWLSWGFQSCRLPACKGCNPTFPNRHPRAKATSRTGTPGPRPLPQQAPQGQATAMAFYGLSKLPFASPQTLQNSPNAPNPAKPAKPSKHRPQQAPQIHSNDFLEAFKAAVCEPAKAATPPSPTGTPGPRPLPEQAPQGQGHFPNRHPKARPQQWLSMGFQSCRLPARKRSKTLQTLQMLPNPPNPPNTVRSRPSRSTAMTFLRLSKLPFASLQRLQPHLPQQAPQGQGHFPNRHPRARPQQWLSMGFQSCRLPARKRSETLQTL